MDPREHRCEVFADAGSGGTFKLYYAKHLDLGQLGRKIIVTELPFRLVPIVERFNEPDLQPDEYLDAAKAWVAGQERSWELPKLLHAVYIATAPMPRDEFARWRFALLLMLAACVALWPPHQLENERFWVSIPSSDRACAFPPACVLLSVLMADAKSDGRAFADERVSREAWQLLRAVDVSSLLGKEDVLSVLLHHTGNAFARHSENPFLAHAWYFCRTSRHLQDLETFRGTVERWAGPSDEPSQPFVFYRFHGLPAVEIQEWQKSEKKTLALVEEVLDPLYADIVMESFFRDMFKPRNGLLDRQKVIVERLESFVFCLYTRGALFYPRSLAAFARYLTKQWGAQLSQAYYALEPLLDYVLRYHFAMEFDEDDLDVFMDNLQSCLEWEGMVRTPRILKILAAQDRFLRDNVDDADFYIFTRMQESQVQLRRVGLQLFRHFSRTLLLPEAITAKILRDFVAWDINTGEVLRIPSGTLALEEWRPFEEHCARFTELMQQRSVDLALPQSSLS